MSNIFNGYRKQLNSSSFIPPLLGGIFALVLLYVLRFPSKYLPAAILLLMGAPLIILVKDKKRFFLAAFLFLLPIDLGLRLVQRYETTNSKVGMLSKFYLVDIFLIGLLIIWMIETFNKRHRSDISITRNRITPALLLWIGAGALSLFPAIDRMATSLEILNMLRIFLVYFIVFHYFDGQDDLAFITKWLSLGFLAQSVLILAQYATGSLLIDLPGTSIGVDIVERYFRPTGTLGHSGHFAKYAGMMLPVIFSYAIFSIKVKDKTFYALVWLVGSIALALTISRAGIMTWILAIAAFFVGLLSLRIISRKRFLRISLVYGLVICLAFAMIYLTAGRPLMDRMHEDSGSTAMRMPTFKVALNMIQHNPILGVGLRNYTLRHQEYDRTKEQISIRMPSTKVHNLFLLYASEIGIPGLLFFLWFLWVLLKNSMRCARAGNDIATKAAFLAIAIGGSSLVIQSMTGMGVIDRIIHLSIIAIFAGVSAKQVALMKQVLYKQGASR